MSECEEDFFAVLGDGLLGGDDEEDDDSDKENEPFVLKPGLCCKYTSCYPEEAVTVVQMPNPNDFFHGNQALIRRKSIAKDGKEVVSVVWVDQDALAELTDDDAHLLKRHKPVPDSALNSIATAARPLDANKVDVIELDPELEAKLAAHERGRRLKRKAGARTPRGTVNGSHARNATSVSLTARIKQYPNDPLATSLRTSEVFCKCCRVNIQNIKSTIDTHVKSSHHVARKQQYRQVSAESIEQKSFLEEYYRDHADEKGSSLSSDVHLERMRMVAAFMKAGIPLQKLDALRPTLERNGCCMTDSSHMRQYIPKLEEIEVQHLRQEVQGRKLGIVFDGSSRLGECMVVLVRWIQDDFSAINQRLICVKTLEKSMSGNEVGTFLMGLLLSSYAILPADIVASIRDSCATNGKAERNLSHVLPNMESMKCISHTLSHVGEHVKLPTVSKFMVHWISLMSHHPSAKRLWKERIGVAMKRFSHIRWCSREECAAQLALKFQFLEGWVDDLIANNVGAVTTSEMSIILQDHALPLQLELALTLDLECITSTCYSLEGDGLCILLARKKIDALMATLREMGSDARTLPNLAACLRQKSDLKVGTSVYELFTEGLPTPKWFSGNIINPRTPNLISVRYSDNTVIDQNENEVRQWIDVRQMPEWVRLTECIRQGLTYLHNRLTGNLPPRDKPYDCSHMYEVLRLCQAFNPTWAVSNVKSELVDQLPAIVPLADMGPALQAERISYLSACQDHPIGPTDDMQEFTAAILAWWAQHGRQLPAWSSAAKIVFSMNCNSAAAERVFSMLTRMFGDSQDSALADYIQTALMLAFNKRVI